ncbi:hypothetical protein V6N11_033183, partial [Hibiscus sabdariffa]
SYLCFVCSREEFDLFNLGVPNPHFKGKGFLGDSSGSCALEVDMSETPCLSASIPLRSRQQARIYVVEDGSEEGIPQSKSTDLAHGVSMACPLGSSERN